MAARAAFILIQLLYLPHSPPTTLDINLYGRNFIPEDLLSTSVELKFGIAVTQADIVDREKQNLVMPYVGKHV